MIMYAIYLDWLTVGIVWDNNTIDMVDTGRTIILEYNVEFGVSDDIIFDF